MNEVKIEDYECYWQKGGTYVLPVEVFNSLFYEIEQLQQKNKELENEISNIKASYETEAEAKFYEYLEKSKKVMIEFEKWLENRLQEECKVETPNETTLKVILNKKYYVFNECLNKLQELKEGHNIKNDCEVHDD